MMQHEAWDPQGRTSIMPNRASLALWVMLCSALGGVSLYIGTGAPGAQGLSPQPLSDAARLSAKYTLMPTAETKAKYGPIVQEWDLRLAR